FGFDGVKFQMIRNWNTYSPAEFERHHIGAPGHPDYAEFLEVLADPAFDSGRVEFWGMAGPMRGARPGAGGGASPLARRGRAGRRYGAPAGPLQRHDRLLEQVVGERRDDHQQDQAGQSVGRPELALEAVRPGGEEEALPHVDPVRD